MVIIKCETGVDVTVEGDTLVGANISRLDLHRALLDGQDLSHADLSGSDLRSAWLENAVLDGANLVGTRMPAVNARGARFVGANLQSAFLSSGIFDGADFRGANLQRAEAGRARLRSALLAGADLRGANLADTDMSGVIADDSTLWPDGFTPALHGVSCKEITLTMRVHRVYRCEYGHEWIVASHKHVPEAASDAVCPEGHEAVTCCEELPADEVQVVFRPAARIVDQVTGATRLSGRYYLVLLDRADRELCVSSNHYAWEQALMLANLFKGKDVERALIWWKRRAP